MQVKVTFLEKPSDFRVRVSFNDGSGGIHDFRAGERTGADAGAAARPSYFARVFLEFGAPTWLNGFDISPEWLRREMEKAGELTHEAAE